MINMAPWRRRKINCTYCRSSCAYVSPLNRPSTRCTADAGASEISVVAEAGRALADMRKKLCCSELFQYLAGTLEHLVGEIEVRNKTDGLFSENGGFDLLIS